MNRECDPSHISNEEETACIVTCDFAHFCLLVSPRLLAQGGVADTLSSVFAMWRASHHASCFSNTLKPGHGPPSPLNTPRRTWRLATHCTVCTTFAAIAENQVTLR